MGLVLELPRLSALQAGGGAESWPPVSASSWVGLVCVGSLPHWGGGRGTGSGQQDGSSPFLSHHQFVCHLPPGGRWTLHAG